MTRTTKTTIAGSFTLMLAACTVACGPADAAAEEPLPPVVDASDDADEVGGDAATDAADADAGPPAPLPIPKLVSTAETCKLINGTKNEDPTPNQTHFHANVMGTDLGIPVAHAGTLYFLFGDTVGFKGIWPFGDSQPDAGGFSLVSPAAVALDPATLCTNLRFLTLPAAGSIGPTLDVRIERDFAGVSMTPPSGHAIGEYIHNPAGHAFPTLPGDFEVPSGTFSYGGSIYVFYTTVNQAIEMKGSYLAKWGAPSTTATPAYDILYDVDQRFTTMGPLNGDFINIAPLVVGNYVYLFGTGDFRKSTVHLARKLLTSLAQPGGFERYDAKTKTWGAPGTPGDPIVTSQANGELSVRYYPSIKRYVMLNQEEGFLLNRIVARFAEAPEGPWSDVVVHDFFDAAFQAKYCCATTTTCVGEQLFHCDRGGFYGTYLLPDVAVSPGGAFSLSYTMSTWDPYNVALMRATFQ